MAVLRLHDLAVDLDMESTSVGLIQDPIRRRPTRSPGVKRNAPVAQLDRAADF
jgi:hypothetical protein